MQYLSSPRDGLGSPVLQSKAFSFANISTEANEIFFQSLVAALLVPKNAVAKPSKNILLRHDWKKLPYFSFALIFDYAPPP